MNRRNFISTVSLTPFLGFFGTRAGAEPNSFESFVASAGQNLQARETVRAFIANEEVARPSLLTIVSSVGNEGTHLALAAKLELARISPFKTVHFGSAERYADEYKRWESRNRLEYFRARYFGAYRFLILDQIASLHGNESAQRELSRLLCHFRFMGRQIILTTSKHPKNQPQLFSGLRRQMLRNPIVEISSLGGKMLGNVHKVV